MRAGTRIAERAAIRMLHRLRPLIISTLCGASVAYGAIALSPDRYMARAAVMLQEGGGSGAASRIVKIAEAAGDPAAATQKVALQLADYRRQKATLLDDVVVTRSRPDLAYNTLYGGLAGLAFGIGLLVVRERRRRAVRNEGDLVQALGEPLLAARPLRLDALDDLCRQLLDHWFTPQRRLLPVVSAEPGEGRSRVAAALARRFAAMGEPVLLVDADFRSPSLHTHFELPNRAGLADFLEGRQTGVAQCGEHLGVIVAGSCRGGALEALASTRLPALLFEAGKHFRVILVDTPAASRGPDLQMPAALAGGALVVARPGPGRAPALEQLHAFLDRGAARVVATLVNHG
jgi:Mrp family chromosome partitioning ATPase